MKDRLKIDKEELWAKLEKDERMPTARDLSLGKWVILGFPSFLIVAGLAYCMIYGNHTSNPFSATKMHNNDSVFPTTKAYADAKNQESDEVLEPVSKSDNIDSRYPMGSSSIPISDALIQEYKALKDQASAGLLSTIDVRQNKQKNVVNHDTVSTQYSSNLKTTELKEAFRPTSGLVDQHIPISQSNDNAITSNQTMNSITYDSSSLYPNQNPILSPRSEPIEEVNVPYGSIKGDDHIWLPIASLPQLPISLIKERHYVEPPLLLAFPDTLIPHPNWELKFGLGFGHVNTTYESLEGLPNPNQSSGVAAYQIECALAGLMGNFDIYGGVGLLGSVSNHLWHEADTLYKATADGSTYIRQRLATEANLYQRYTTLYGHLGAGYRQSFIGLIWRPHISARYHLLIQNSGSIMTQSVESIVKTKLSRSLQLGAGLDVHIPLTDRIEVRAGLTFLTAMEVMQEAYYAQSIRQTMYNVGVVHRW